MLILISPESVFTSPSRIHSVHPILIRSVNVVFDRCSQLTCLTVVNSRERRRCDPTMRIAVATIDTSLLTDHWSGPGMTHADDDIDLFVWDILTLDWRTALWTRVDLILISWILVNTDFIGDQEQPYNFYPEEDSRSNSCFRYETGPERLSRCGWSINSSQLFILRNNHFRCIHQESWMISVVLNVCSYFIQKLKSKVAE